jgi:hypothetical protein
VSYKRNAIYTRESTDRGVGSGNSEECGFGYELLGRKAFSGLVVASLEEGGEEVVAILLGKAPRHVAMR